MTPESMAHEDLTAPSYIKPDDNYERIPASRYFDGPTALSDQKLPPKPSAALEQSPNELSSYQDTITALTSQLKAMETAFILQERALARDVVVGTGKRGEITSSSDGDEYHDERQHFPYAKLLQQWRRAAVESIYSKISLERQLSRYGQVCKTLRQQSKQTQLKCEAASISLKERLAASQQLCDSLQKQVETLNKNLSDERSARKSSDRLRQANQNLAKQVW